jgi:uncharacterized protein YebE (UPF0316 family)
MVFEQILNSPWYSYLILPLLIFFGRIIDVSIGTIKTIFISKGFRKIAPFLSFIEILVWLLVARQVLTDLSNVVAYFAYAAGFATGTYVGMKIEEKLSVGKVILRIITGVEPQNLIKELKAEKYGLTIMNAKGMEGDVKVIFLVMDRTQLNKALDLLKKHHQYDSFYTIEDVRYAHENGSNPKKKFLNLIDLGK